MVLCQPPGERGGEVLVDTQPNLDAVNRAPWPSWYKTPVRLLASASSAEVPSCRGSVAHFWVGQQGGAGVAAMIRLFVARSARASTPSWRPSA